MKEKMNHIVTKNILFGVVTGLKVFQSQYNWGKIVIEFIYKSKIPYEVFIYNNKGEIISSWQEQLLEIAVINAKELVINIERDIEKSNKLNN